MARSVISHITQPWLNYLGLYYPHPKHLTCTGRVVPEDSQARSIFMSVQRYTQIWYRHLKYYDATLHNTLYNDIIYHHGPEYEKHISCEISPRPRLLDEILEATRHPTQASPFQSQMSPLSNGTPQTDGTVGALMTRLGFGGILYYNYNQESPK